MKVVVRRVFIFSKWLIGSFLLLTLISLFPSPIYDFEEPKPFSGENWHNPYQNVTHNNWQSANFHAHSKAWGGLTNGVGNPEEVFNTYKNDLGYDWVGISNYQEIAHIDASHYIPVYEHVTSFTKNHHLIIGAKKEVWFDYPFLQFLDQKQDMLNRLKEEDNLLVLNHPKLRGAYSKNDMKYLRGYDLLEVLNHVGRSREHWDAALSAGFPIFLISSDDSHDHTDLSEVGQNVTMIHNPQQNKSTLLSALKNGEAYGVDVCIRSFDKKDRKDQIANVPKPKIIELNKDSLIYEFDIPFKEIRFIGQHGKMLSSISHRKKATYHLQDNDTYVRVWVKFEDPGYELYFNPVYRYDDRQYAQALPIVNNRKTRLFKGIIAYSILGILLFILLKRGSKPSKIGVIRQPQIAFK